MRTPSHLGLWSAALFALASGSCVDPVHDQQVKALGDERAGVPVGEFHRAGQPCVACHGEYGPASTTFTIAGTIFDGPTKAVGVDQAEVYMVDANGVKPTKSIVTNCVGNFWVTPDTWQPAFPVLVWIRKPGDTSWVRMNSHIGREPSCNACHFDPPSVDAVGHIHLHPSDTDTPPPTCPVSPVLGGSGGAQ